MTTQLRARDHALSYSDHPAGATVVRVAIPELVRRGAVRKVEAYCDAREPKGVSDQVRLEAGVRGNAVTIVERRPPWREGIGPDWTTLKIAQLRYDAAAAMWTLFWADRNGRWLRYPGVEPASSIETLIAAFDVIVRARSSGSPGCQLSTPISPRRLGVRISTSPIASAHSARPSRSVREPMERG